MIVDDMSPSQKTSTLSLDTISTDCLIPILSYLRVEDIQRCYTSCRSLHSQNDVMLQVIFEVDRYREKGFGPSIRRTQSLDRGYLASEISFIPSISLPLEKFLCELISDRKDKEIQKDNVKFEQNATKVGIQPNATRKRFNFMQNKKRNSNQSKGKQYAKKGTDQNLCAAELSRR